MELIFLIFKIYANFLVAMNIAQLAHALAWPWESKYLYPLLLVLNDIRYLESLRVTQVYVHLFATLIIAQKQHVELFQFLYLLLLSLPSITQRVLVDLESEI